MFAIQMQRVTILLEATPVCVTLDLLEMGSIAKVRILKPLINEMNYYNVHP